MNQLLRTASQDIWSSRQDFHIDKRSCTCRDCVNIEDSAILFAKSCYIGCLCEQCWRKHDLNDIRLWILRYNHGKMYMPEFNVDTQIYHEPVPLKCICGRPVGQRGPDNQITSAAKGRNYCNGKCNIFEWKAAYDSLQLQLLNGQRTS